MIEVIKNIIDMIMIFVRAIYNIEIDLMPNFNVKMGDLCVAFISFLLIIYLILKYGFGIEFSKGDDD